MQRILVISYFYPPCNLTASQRVFSWAKYLHRFGYYPIIITRRWDIELESMKDMSIHTGTEILHEKFDTHEVYYLPYFPNLKDRIYTKFGDRKFLLLRKTLSFFELVLQNFFNWPVPYKNIYVFAHDFLEKNRDVKKLATSGSPFIQFKFGYLLHKKFGVKWIADYRDAWTTSEITHISKGGLYKLILWIEKFFEKKWVGTTSLVTASSKPIGDGITKLTGVKSEPLYNGFVKTDFEELGELPPFEQFTITYIGTLYEGQKIEVFCNAFKKLIDSHNQPKIKFLLPGISFYKDQKQRIEKLLKGYEDYYECTERMERRKILEIEKKSHLLLHIAWKGFKGIIASKIYEYIASGSYILVTPSDHGSIAEIINNSGCGLVADSEEETYTFLESAYKKYLDGVKLTNDLDTPAVNQFSRKFQVQKLAELLDKI